MKQRLAAIKHVEQEGRLRAFTVLPPPQLFLVGRCCAEPPFAVLFVQGDLTERRIDQAHQTLGDQPKGLIEVDRGCDRAADVGAQLELVAMAPRHLYEG